MQTILVLAAVLLLLGLALRHKFRRDGIYQGGARVGSALPGSLMTPESATGAFVIIRGQIGGTAPFREGEPFTHRGAVFSIVSVGARDESSPVLLRLFDVTCRVEGRARVVRGA